MGSRRALYYSSDDSATERSSKPEVQVFVILPASHVQAFTCSGPDTACLLMPVCAARKLKSHDTLCDMQLEQ